MHWKLWLVKHMDGDRYLRFLYDKLTSRDMSELCVRKCVVTHKQRAEALAKLAEERAKADKLRRFIWEQTRPDYQPPFEGIIQ